jgi:hypothetical protein
MQRSYLIRQYVEMHLCLIPVRVDYVQSPFYSFGISVNILLLYHLKLNLHYGSIDNTNLYVMTTWSFSLYGGGIV